MKLKEFIEERKKLSIWSQSDQCDQPLLQGQIQQDIPKYIERSFDLLAVSVMISEVFTRS